MAEPAPPGKSSAVAAEVKGALGIGRSNAAAGSQSGEATANAVEIGSTVVAGGKQSGTGKKGGALFDSGATALGRIQLAPWAAEAVAGTDSSSASSQAALLRLMLVNSGVLDANVLQSQSKATWTGDKSTSTTSSDGATVNVGGPNGLMLVLLHSEANSEAKGSSYVASVNGTKVLTSDQAGTSCAVAVPNVAQLNCLLATGGNGSSSAQAAAVNAGGANGLTANLLQASGQSGTGVADEVLSRNVGDDGDISRAAAAGDSGNALAFTGSSSWFLAMLGAAVMALGTVVHNLRRILPGATA